MDLGLNERTAVVLGGTSGIGAEISRQLDAEGARVAVVGRSATHDSDPVGQLRHGLAVRADVTDPGADEQIVTSVEAAYGPIDVLVLNGGGPPPGGPVGFGRDDVSRAVDLLVQPHVAMIDRVLPAMLERGWGRIIAIGSSGVQQPLPDLTASNVGRAALAGYLKTLAGEVAGRGVTVNMVLPGRIATGRVARLDQAAAERTGRSAEDVRRASEATIPVGRYGTPAEFASVVVFLAGTPAAYVTGEQVRCDGGLIRHH